jgi:hypothetical protein
MANILNTEAPCMILETDGDDNQVNGLYGPYTFEEATKILKDEADKRADARFRECSRNYHSVTINDYYCTTYQLYALTKEIEFVEAEYDEEDC